MKIKKYIAPTLSAGQKKIAAELGGDAIVLSSRSVKDPKSGKNMYEIVAAIDDAAKPINKTEASPKRSPASRPEIDFAPKRQAAVEQPDENERGEFLETAGEIYNEIGALKSMMSEALESIKYKYSGALNPAISEVYKQMRKEGFSDDFSLSVAGRLSESDINLKDKNTLFDNARKLILDGVNFYPQLEKKGERVVAAFVGTTGCGKTTTLVKLAIVAKLVMSADVLIISADTYKVGGAEQLQTFAQVSGIPFRAVYSPEELETVVKQEFQRDFIFIDTTGRSQNDPKQLEYVREHIEKAKSDAVFLVQSCATSPEVFADIIEKFEPFKPNALVLTKFDEVSSVGAIVESLIKNKEPVAYFTNGQRIPDDVEPASVEELAKSILNIETEKKDEDSDAKKET